jgi:ABC-type sugar transport system ATPase subunit
MTAREPDLIEMRNITKQFGRVVALSDVSLSLRENEIMGLLGDNGAGKSTLVKTLVGIHQPDTGEVRIRGSPVRIENPKEAREHGIATVYQDLALIDEMSVAANMFLARQPVRRVAGFLEVLDWDRMNERAATILEERLNISIDPTTEVEFLSGGERQAVAIGRALVTDPDVVVLDEPTSALSADSAARVRDLIRTLREEGIAVLMITHNLDEAFGLTDRVTVLHSGRSVGAVRSGDVDKDDIVSMMITGDAPEGIDVEASPPSKPAGT